jgi:hypothetical protein
MGADIRRLDRRDNGHVPLGLKWLVEEWHNVECYPNCVTTSLDFFAVHVFGFIS